MPKVRNITRGTPISTEVFNDHANAINFLYDDVAGHTNGLIINRPDRSQVARRIMEAQVVAHQVQLASAARVTANSPIAWEISFSPAFADIPVVTTGLVVAASSPAMSKRGIVSLSSISASGVAGTVIFPEDGANVSVSVNIVAVGLAKV